jgi:hypothetical protein
VGETQEVEPEKDREVICVADRVSSPLLVARRDTRRVITDPQARCFGTPLNDRSLTRGDRPRLGPTRFEDWLSSRSMAVAR